MHSPVCTERDVLPDYFRLRQGSTRNCRAPTIWFDRPVKARNQRSAI
jgi:hypothetical protein